MVAGRKAFQGNTKTSTILEILNKEPTSLSAESGAYQQLRFLPLWIHEKDIPVVASNAVTAICRIHRPSGNTSLKRLKPALAATGTVADNPSSAIVGAS
jgi:hypothetical protein